MDSTLQLMKLYYHKTEGEAEYLCSNNVEDTNEGSLKSKYIIRIDGNIKEDAELTIKDEETIEINYYSPNDFPALDKIIEKDGKKYKVVDNSIRNITTAKLVK